VALWRQDHVQGAQGTGGVCLTSEGCVQDEHKVMLVYDIRHFLPAGAIQLSTAQPASDLFPGITHCHSCCLFQGGMGSELFVCNLG
jgi:hypothetical protein